MIKKFKQPSPYISGQVFDFKPLIFRISKSEYSIFSFKFKEQNKRSVTVFVTQELKQRLINEMKENDFVGLKLDKLEWQYAKNSYKLRDFKIYRSEI